MGTQVRAASVPVRTVQFAHTAATTALTPIVNSSRVWLPLNTAAQDETNTFIYLGEISGAPKTTGEAWAKGQVLYWDPATGKFTTTAGSLVKCGYALEAAGSADTTGGLMLFDTFAA